MKPGRLRGAGRKVSPKWEGAWGRRDSSNQEMGWWGGESFGSSGDGSLALEEGVTWPGSV